MAKRESKGQQVKTFKYFEAQEDGLYEERIAKVYFIAADGDFTIYLPEHFHGVVEVLPIFADSEHVGGGGKARLHHDKAQIFSKVVDTVVEAFKTINRQYFEHLTELQAVKVIKVTFQANLPYSRTRAEKGQYVFHGAGSVGSNDISFGGFPAVHMTYEVLWRAGDILYRKDVQAAWGDRPERTIMRYRENPFLHLGSRTDARERMEKRIVPWTEEKEAFLCNTVNKIIELGWMMKDFFGDTEANLAHAISSGTGMLSLAPPSETVSEEVDHAE